MKRFYSCDKTPFDWFKKPSYLDICPLCYKYYSLNEVNSAECYICKYKICQEASKAFLKTEHNSKYIYLDLKDNRIRFGINDKPESFVWFEFEQLPLYKLLNIMMREFRKYQIKL